jgi:hypothetical protein
MDRQAELQAERDALEGELLALEQTIRHQWPQCTVVPAELAQRVEDLLGRLRLVNKALSEPGGSAPK